MIGKTISHYKILEKLGGGGMGVVYKAQDLKLDRLVALKFLPPYLTLDVEAKERFIHEAKAASALQHNNICNIHDIDESADGQMFMVMDCYEGETLKDRIGRGPLKTEEALDIAVQIAQGLIKAHEKSIVHRDIKPANIFITKDGVVKILDFGLAKLSKQIKITRTGTTLGTVAYMSPEQAGGKGVDHRTDIWSLGVVLYEMLAKELPFKGEYEQAVIYSILNEEPESLEKIKPSTPSELQQIVHCALQKNAESRYPQASDILSDLKKYQQSLKESEKRRPNLPSLLYLARKPRFAVPSVMIILALCFLTVWLFNRQAKIRQAKEELLPRIDKLIEAGQDNYIDAYKLAMEAEKYIPHNRKLSENFTKIAADISIKTEPPEAKVYMKEYKTPESEWDCLGSSPIDKIRLPYGFYRIKMEKDGYKTVFAAYANYELNWKSERLFAPKNIERTLDKKGEILPGMVRVKGDSLRETGELDDFFIDQYEVTNKQFKEFIDKDGYRKKEYWKQKFIKNGKEVTWDEALKEFVDQTGISGPATWQAGDYPEGQDEYPVNGISWYEAAAYAQFVGKSLPTVYHWGIAGKGEISSWLLTRGFYTFLAPQSNFNGKGPAPVGSNPGMTPCGAYDMAGNVREWCWNESPKGRIIRGGAWNDATYMFSNWSQDSPFNRSSKNGFRCTLYQDHEKIPQSALESVKIGQVPDFYQAKPVSNSIFQVYKEQFAYDKADLDAQLEWRNESSEDWTQEKISFNAAYDNERMIAYLFLPRKTPPPYQAILYFPGAGSILQKTSKDMDKYWEFDVRLSLLVKNGRAVLYPIYKGTFERGDNALTEADVNSHLYSEFVIKLVKDFKRCIDYLETRREIDDKKLAYFGFSWGGSMGAIIPAVEDRIKVSILAVGGLDGSGRPEVNDVNYVTRVKIPTLMLNGKYDMSAPYETSAKPMFDLFGTPREDKQLKLYDTDHFIPKNEFTKEVLTWLDSYLGPVK